MKPDAAEQERLRAVLDGLRSIGDPDDPRWHPATADARAVVQDAWSVLADLLGGQPQAAALVDTLRRLTIADQALLGAGRASRQLGGVLHQLESAPAGVADLVSLAPRLTAQLGFDRAIFSRVVDGMWISETVYVADDPQWAAEINRVGQDQPQRLSPGLREAEMVRRRTAIVVTDVQSDSRVHRPIADESRSQSYVAAPIMSGNRVVGLLHGDCYLQGRQPDAAQCETFVAYARGLQLALSRAHLAERLQAVGSMLRLTANQCRDGADTAPESTLRGAARVAERAPRTVRDMLTAREAEILELMAEGLSNAGIAARLVISEGTVKQHVKHILRKLGAGNRVEAVSMLYRSEGA